MVDSGRRFTLDVTLRIPEKPMVLFYVSIPFMVVGLALATTPLLATMLADRKRPSGTSTTPVVDPTADSSRTYDQAA